MDSSIIVQTPVHPAESLVLLFHGVGADPANLIPLAEHIAKAQPNAAVVSVAAPYASDFGRGRQWFSVAGITEENREERIAAVMPEFAQTVARWQKTSGCTPTETTLVGFSQGAIMSLAATQLAQPIASRVIAIAGRFAKLPENAANTQQLYLLHGEQDSIVAPSHSVQAAQRIQALGGTVSLTLVPGLGHGMDGRVLNQVGEIFAKRT